MPMSKHFRRARKIVTTTIVVALSLLLLVLVLLLIRPVRERVLDVVLARVRGGLAGELTLADATWPAPGRLALSSVIWTVENDTLLAVDDLVVEIQLSALARRDLVVPELTARCRLLDVPRIQAALATDEAAPPAEAPSKGSSFPRAGALPPLPSLAVGEATVTCSRLVLSPDRAAGDLAIAAGLELRTGREPQMQLDASARAEGDGWQLTAGGGRNFELALTRSGSVDLTDGPGIVLVGELGGGHGAAYSLDLRGQFRTPDINQAAGPVGNLVSEVIWQDDGPEVDLQVSASGLTLDAAAGLVDGELDARADLGVRGASWLVLFAPTTTPPESLTADIQLVCAGPLPAPSLTATVDAAMQMGEVELDRFELALALDEGWKAAQTEWNAQANGLAAAGSLELTRDGELVAIRTTPIEVARSNKLDVDAAQGAPRNGVADIGMEDLTATIAGVQITGALGEIEIDGTWRSAALQAHLDAVWPDLPEALALVLDESVMEALREHWHDGAAWGVGVRVTQEDSVLGVDANLRLPGPRHLAGLLPPDLDVADLGAIEGSARLRRDVFGGLDLGLDLSPSQWIDTGLVAGRVVGDSLCLDDLRLVALGVEIAISGAADRQDVIAEVRASIPDIAPLLQRAGVATEDGQGEARLSVSVSGSRSAPDLRVDLAASGAIAGVAVPEIIGRADLSGGALNLIVSAPAGLDANGQHLDVARAGYDGAMPGHGEGRASLVVEGPDLRAQAGFLMELGDAVNIRGDTLTVVLLDRDLTLQGPFTLDRNGGTGQVRLSDLVMTGSLGHLRLDGSLIDATATGDLDLQLSLPETVFPPSVPAALRPNALTITANATTAARRAKITAHGLVLGSRDDLVVMADIEDATSGLDALVTVVDQGDTLAVAVAATTRETLADLGAGATVPLQADLKLQDLPLPPLSGTDQQGRDVVLNGTITLRGTTAAPTGELHVSASPRGWPQLASHRLNLNAELSAGDAAAAGVRADLELVRADRRLASGSLVLPGTASLSPPAFAADEDKGLSASLEADRLQLEEFSPLLPATMGLRGALDLALSASGSTRNPELTGNAALQDGRATLPDGSWVAFGGTSDLQGELMSPAVTGALVINGGVLRLPDPPRSLHPVGARPLLWKATGDSLGGGAPGDPGSSLDDGAAREETPPPFDPTVNMRVTVPSGLWLRGSGLEVTLLGDLDLRTLAGRHDISGELTAASGSYRFLGRNFSVERGVVSFDAGKELNPGLDLSLTTQLDDVLYRIAFGGTLLKPTLLLTSEPEMPEGDIMAMLLFGRRLDELGNDQEGLVKDRATDLLAAFGTAQLEARLAQQLNVDMVNLRRGGVDESDSLVIGKHLNERVLLKYEQALDEWSSFFVNLEYILSRYLKLETMISRHGQSAAAINWSVDY